MKCVILLAPPLAGKGTVSHYIEDKYNYKHISTGDLLREESKNNEDIKDLINNGKFVSDELVLDVFKKYLSTLNENIILDGIPRNINQAVELNLILDEFNVEIDKILNIDVDKETLTKRVLNRLSCEKCKRVYSKESIDSKICTVCGGNLISRSDDNAYVFTDRYNTYMKETNPLLSYYKNKVVTIKNETTLEDLFNNIDKLFKGDDINDNN